MGWGLIVISVVVAWVASFLNVLLSPAAASSFLTDGRGAHKRKNVLLAIAHPDDESMFFTPTINYLVSRGHNLHVLCLSIGNFDGLGSVRRDELYRACAMLKVPLDQVKILDHPDLQDGFGLAWDHDLLAKIIEDEASRSSIEMVISFDDYGVSGHCNHRDVHFGIRKLLVSPGRGIEAWELVSTSIFRKYSGPIDIWLSKFLSAKSDNGPMYCLINEHPRKSFRAMAEHSSQWVWYASVRVHHLVTFHYAFLLWYDLCSHLVSSILSIIFPDL